MQGRCVGQAGPGQTISPRNENFDHKKLCRKAITTAATKKASAYENSFK